MDENQHEAAPEQGLFDNYQETQKELLFIYTRKVRNKLFAAAAVIFLSDLIGLAVARAVLPATILVILVVPVLFIGLAFLSLKEPLTAMIIAALLIAAVWVYTIIITGGRAAIQGWLVKALLIYLIIAGFQSAVEANRIKKELKS